MWVPIFPVAPLPLWQLAHCVAEVNRLWSGLEALQLLVVLWQDSQLPVTAEWIDVAGLPVTPYAVLRWQVAHCADTDTLP